MRRVRGFGMPGVDLRAMRVAANITQAQLAKRMRLKSRSRLSMLEQQMFVQRETVLHFWGAVVRELLFRADRIERDHDPEDWGLPAGPAKPLEMEYRWRPRDKRGRWLPSYGRVPQGREDTRGRRE